MRVVNLVLAEDGVYVPEKTWFEEVCSTIETAVEAVKMTVVETAENISNLLK